MFDIQVRARLGTPDHGEIQLLVVDPVLKQLVGDMVAAAPLATGRFKDCTAHLYTNAIVVGPGTVVGDLVEAAFPGYAASAAVTFSAAGLDDVGNHVVIGDVPAFTVTGDPAGAQVMGIYLLGGGVGTPLLAVGRLPAPQGLTNGELIPATVVLSVGNS